MKNAAMASFTALTIASNVLTNAPMPAQASVDFAGSSTMVSEKVVREGLYGEYEVDITQSVDDARSTFKAAKETKSKKGTLVFLLLFFATLGDMESNRAIFTFFVACIWLLSISSMIFCRVNRQVHCFACCSRSRLFRYSYGTIFLVCQG